MVVPFSLFHEQIMLPRTHLNGALQVLKYPMTLNESSAISRELLSHELGSHACSHEYDRHTEYLSSEISIRLQKYFRICHHSVSVDRFI